MPCASSGCERPENTISRFCGPRSIQWPGWGSLTAAAGSSPGSTSSVVPVSSGISLLVLLTRPCNRERVCRHILGYHGSGCSPSPVTHVHGRDEGILDAGPDVLPDPSTSLGKTRFVRVVGGDVARADVRPLTDLGVADVGEVRHLGFRPDA